MKHKFDTSVIETANSVQVFQSDNNDQDTHLQTRLADQDIQSQAQEIDSRLTSWQTVQIARHKDRPYAADYLHFICDDFMELHGDRAFGDDHSILAGLGIVAGDTVMFV